MQVCQSFTRVLVLLMALLFLPLIVRAEQATSDSSHQVAKVRSKPMFGLKFGGMAGGKVSIEDVDTLSSFEFTRELDAGLSMGAFFEFSSPAWTTAGLSLDFHQIKPTGSSDQKWMIDAGVVIKSSMRQPHQRLALRPLIGISYGYIPALEGVTESASFMIAKLGGEVVYFPHGGKVGVVLEACLAASPFGRSFSADDEKRYDIAARPRPMVRVGMVLR